MLRTISFYLLVTVTISGFALGSAEIWKTIGWEVSLLLFILAYGMTFPIMKPRGQERADIYLDVDLKRVLKMTVTKIASLLGFFVAGFCFLESASVVGQPSLFSNPYGPLGAFITGYLYTFAFFFSGWLGYAITIMYSRYLLKNNNGMNGSHV